MLALIVLGSLLAAPASFGLQRLFPSLKRWVLPIFPFVPFTFLCFKIPEILKGLNLQSSYPWNGGVLTERYAWVPALGLEFAFTLDALSLLFALIILGMALLIVIYAPSYFSAEVETDAFFAFLFSSMASMLGLVLSSNLFLIFIFWELTSVSSYFLISFKASHLATTRSNMQQALLITTGGSLALLLSLLLLVQIMHGEDLSANANFQNLLYLEKKDLTSIQNNELYAPIVLLFLVGCFTKSAQFPFHFWLPNTMEAPIPVSAYLHSATMVKAGIYLLARFSPVLGGTPLWQNTLIFIGTLNLVFGVVFAAQQNDLKGLLAYHTISQLGSFVILAGLGGPQAAQALAVGILAHALSKGSLFLLVGNLEREMESRNLRVLSGLRRVMPLTATLLLVAALSMAGLPGTLGFIAKELNFAGIVANPSSFLRYFSYGATLLSSFLGLFCAWRLGKIVFGRKLRKKRGLPKIKEVGITMLVGPLLLLLLSLGLGFWGILENKQILVPNITVVQNQPAELKNQPAGSAEKKKEPRAEKGKAASLQTLQTLLSANRVLIALGLSWLGGGILLFFEPQITSSRLPIPPWLSFNQLYALIGANIPHAAREFTLLLQGGKLRIYVALLLMSLLGLVSPSFYLFVSQEMRPLALETLLADVRLYEYGIIILIPIGILVTIWAKTTLDAIMGVGVVGALLALLFVLFGAPDLALTQLIVELLSLVLLLFIFSVLPPRFEQISSHRTRIRDGLIALSVGALITGLTLTVALSPRNAEVANHYLTQSLPKGHGANVVNIILTDFRSLDTLGEITVLFAAMLGIYGLLYFRQRP